MSAKSFTEIKNTEEIKAHKLALKAKIATQEQVLLGDFDEIKEKWNVFGNNNIQEKVIEGINTAAGYVSAGIVITSKVIDVINEAKKIYKQINNK